jgi:hypothetical protein
VALLMTTREKSKCSRLERRGEFEEHVDTSAHSFGYLAEEEGWQNRRSAVSSSSGSNGGAKLFTGGRKNEEQRGWSGPYTCGARSGLEAARLGRTWREQAEVRRCMTTCHRRGARTEQGSRGGLVGWPMKHRAISDLFKHFSSRFEL